MNPRALALPLAALALLSFGSAGCKRRHKYTPPAWAIGSAEPASAGRPPPTAAPHGSFKSGSLSFDDYKNGFVQVSYEHGSATVRLSYFPKGTKASVGAATTNLGDDGSGTLDVDMSAAYGDLDVKTAFGHDVHLAPKDPLTIVFSNGVTFTTAMPEVPTYAASAREMFAKAADHPVLFGDEAPKPASQRSLVLVGSLDAEVFGPAKKVRDVDWVAVTSNEEPRMGKTCSGYKSSKDNREVSYPLEMIDQTVSIYDRRTSDVVMKKTFKASGGCPMMAFNGHASTYASSDEIKAWLRKARTAAPAKSASL